MTGKLIRWNDEKGYGFIRVESENREIFIHISTLSHMTRRPVVGDVIFFDMETDNNGKQKAVNAKIEGVPRLETSSKSLSLVPTHPAQPKPESRVKSFKPKQSGYRAKRHESNRLGFFSKLIPLLVVFLAVAAYEKSTFSKKTYNHTQILPAAETLKPPPSQFECQGKTHCTQMSSCEEATFYLQNCLGTEMDGDNDGIPCEHQLCN